MKTPIEILENANIPLLEQKNNIKNELNLYQKKMRDIEEQIIKISDAVELLKRQGESNKHTSTEQEDTTHLVAGSMDIMELETQATPANKCTSKIKDMTYNLTDDSLTIRRAQDCVHVSWKYMTELIRDMPEMVMMKSIDGVNRGKVRMIVDFVDAHVNFDCHKARTNGPGSPTTLIRDTVTVGIDTRANGKVEADEPAY